MTYMADPEARERDISSCSSLSSPTSSSSTTNSVSIPSSSTSTPTATPTTTHPQQPQHHPPLNQINDEILNATKEGNHTLLEHLLKKHSTTLHMDDSWHAGILEAARLRQLEALKLLLQYGANINIRDASGATALHKAVGTLSISYDCENVEVVQYLLNNGADPGAKDNLGTTPLHLAARYGQIRIVQLLMENESVQNRSGSLPNGSSEEVRIACSRNRLEPRKPQSRQCCASTMTGCASLLTKASANSPATLRDVLAAVFCIPCFVK